MGKLTDKIGNKLDDVKLNRGIKKTEKASEKMNKAVATGNSKALAKGSKEYGKGIKAQAAANSRSLGRTVKAEKKEIKKK